MADKIMIAVPVPPSTNRLYANKRGGGRIKTQAYKNWIRQAGWDLRLQKPPHMPGYVAVLYYVPWPKRKGKYDLGNREKALSDLLVKHGVIEDDSKIVDLHLKFSTGDLVQMEISRPHESDLPS